jgi:hypothetical protein
MARHILGVLGVLAAGVLLAVSAAMNYRFGFSLGKSAADGQIYGAASVAADCFKALVPFFFFAAWRNRMWSQAFAAAALWVVVTGYSMTSSLGHAAMNRLDTSSQRAVVSANYQDLRADSKRAQDQLTWIPAHRPATTVSAELDVLKAQRQWLLTRECTDVKGKAGREYCQQFHKLSAELASGIEAKKLETRIAEIGSKLAKVVGGNSGVVMTESDPQATVLSRMSGFEIETVQMALTMFVALLIEVGSGFGMYVAFAYWRMHAPMHAPAEATQVTTRPQAAAPVARVAPAEALEAPDTLGLPAPAEAESEMEDAADVAEPMPAAQPPAATRFGANDNRLVAKPQMMPESDVELFYRHAVERAADEDSISSQELYDGYRMWSKANEKRPLNMPRFCIEFENLGYTTIEIGGRKRYFGIALAPELLNAVAERKASARRRKTQDQQALPAPAQTRAA